MRIKLLHDEVVSPVPTETTEPYTKPSKKLAESEVVNELPSIMVNERVTVSAKESRRRAELVAF
jgi:hypothetical protein